MKKLTSLILVLTLALSLVSLAACGTKTTGTSADTSASPSADAASGDKTITVGASATPHAEILEHIKDVLAKQGYTLKIVTYDDYILPNKSLADGEIDANYFQHEPYLKSYNTANNTELVSAAAIHYEPFGIYGNEVTDLKTLAKGATIIIPADDSNETRALFLLQQEGLIKLPADASAEKGVSTLDVTDNGGYDIKTVQADTVPAQLKNSNTGSIAVINGNYALSAGLKISDALATEDAKGTAAQTYANIIAVRKADLDSAKTKALVAALKTDDVKTFIAEKYNGAVVASF